MSLQPTEPAAHAPTAAAAAMLKAVDVASRTIVCQNGDVLRLRTPQGTLNYTRLPDGNARQMGLPGPHVVYEIQDGQRVRTAYASAEDALARLVGPVAADPRIEAITIADDRLAVLWAPGTRQARTAGLAIAF